MKSKDKKIKRFLIACLIFIGILLINGVTSLGNSNASYEIKDYNIHVIVKNNGDLHIEEQIEYRFDTEMNGLTREIMTGYTYKDQKDDMMPTSSRYQASGMKNLEIHTSNTGFSDMQVSQKVASAENGDDGVYTQEHSKYAGQEKDLIKVYSPITQDRKFVTYEYDLTNVSVKYNDAGELYYNFIGGDWNCDIEKANITIQFENTVNMEEVKVYPHTYAKEISEITKKEDQILFHVNNLKGGTAVDARIVFPAEALFTVKKEYQEDYRFDELEKIENKMAFQKDLYYISFLLYLILFLILVLVVIFFVRKTKKIVKGRVIDNKNLEYFRDIPKKRTLREYASLSNYTGESYYTIATILELVNKKIIQMEAKKKEKKKLFEQVEYDYYLTISEGIQNQQLNVDEIRILNMLYLGEISDNFDFNKIENKTVELNESLEKFGKDYSKARKFQEIQAKESKEVHNKLYEMLKKKSIIKPYVISILMITVLFFLTVFVISPANLELKMPALMVGIMILVLVGIISILYFYATLTVVREEYKEDAKQILGLKKYLKEYSLIKERYPIEIALWDQYLVFATLFGIAEQVTKEIKEELIKQGYEEDYIYQTYPIVCLTHESVAMNSFVAQQTGDISSGGYSGGGSGGRRRPEAVEEELFNKSSFRNII